MNVSGFSMMPMNSVENTALPCSLWNPSSLTRLTKRGLCFRVAVRSARILIIGLPCTSYRSGSTPRIISWFPGRFLKNRKRDLSKIPVLSYLSCSAGNSLGDILRRLRKDSMNSLKEKSLLRDVLVSYYLAQLEQVSDFPTAFTTANISEQCKQDSLNYYNAYQSFQLWALQSNIKLIYHLILPFFNVNESTTIE